MTESSGGEAQSTTERASYYREVTRLGVFLAALVVAHFVLRSDRHTSRRIGNVQELHPLELSSYEPPLTSVDPSLIVIGDSQQFMIAPSESNGRLIDGNGDVLVNALGRGFDQRFPAPTPRTYMSFAAPGFSALDALSCLGLWLHRAGPKRVPVLMGFDVVGEPPPPLSNRALAMLKEYPEFKQELAKTLADYPEGPAALRQLNRPSGQGRPTNIAEDVERKLQAWFWTRHYYYGEQVNPLEPAVRYQKTEEPLLRALFGRVVQPGPAPLELAPHDHRFVASLIRYINAQGMTAICYAQPWNPNLVPPSPKTAAMVGQFQKLVTDAGCLFIDATRSVPAAKGNWGWNGGAPDPVHLARAGHETLAKFLLEEGEKVGAWSTFETAGPHGEAGVP